MSDLIDTTEMYLKTILEIIEIGKQPKRANLAARLDQAMPSVSQTVARMTRERLIYLDSQNFIHFTPEGDELAISVMRKHRVAEIFLYKELDFSWVDCHEEACRWEHVLSDAAELKMAEKLGDIVCDPYGNAVPGLALLGLPDPAYEHGTSIENLGIEQGERISAVIRSISEPIQANRDELIQMFNLGITPEAEVVLTFVDNEFYIRHVRGGDSLQLNKVMQSFITVLPQ